jgi:hypothetical protein
MQALVLSIAMLQSALLTYTSPAHRFPLRADRQVFMSGSVLAENDMSGSVLAENDLIALAKVGFPSMRQLVELPAEQRLPVMETHLKKRLTGLQLSRVQVAPSNVEGAGFGLFSTRDISKGELVTMYPCDTIVTTVPGQGDAEEEILFDVNAPTDSEWYENWKMQSPEFIQRAWSYSVRISPGRAVIGNPAATDNAAYLGHMANDFAVCLDSDQTAIEAYLAASEGAANVGLDTASTNGCHVAMVATRDIREGEEIFLSYGSGYWLGPGRVAWHGG